MEPSNAVAAASHHDPYLYYQGLPGFAFDAGLGLWIASSANQIDEVMANPDCVVRPAAEAVPKAIAGTSAGAVFARLVRMNEGPAHANPKLVIAQALAALDQGVVAERCAHFAAVLDARHGLPDGAALTRWMFDLPTYVVADLLGFEGKELPAVAQLTADFVRCLSPLSTPEQLASASTAAQDLRGRFARLPGLTADIRRRAAQAGWEDDDAITANLVGLLSQTHEATAGLIGNSIIALLREPGMQERLRAEPHRAGAFVEEVARHDPPVQNTRRFVARPTSIAGVSLKPGDVILLLLGAASRDGACSDFGHGRHACPGQALALAIAASAVRHLLARPLPMQSLCWTYAPSVNGRLPRFSTTS